ncbi:Transcriptional regulator [Streptomyces albidoflavus]|nr:Transcriptional regulator [Streptomyces albidoflavus]
MIVALVDFTTGREAEPMVVDARTGERLDDSEAYVFTAGPTASAAMRGGAGVGHWRLPSLPRACPVGRQGSPARLLGWRHGQRARARGKRLHQLSTVRPGSEGARVSVG